MQKYIFKGIALAAALSAGAMTLASPAEAGRKGRTAAIILGLGAAAIIANSHRSRSHYYGYGPRPYYYAPPPVSYAPRPVYRYAPPPWSPEWYSYCARKYRSFDAGSGTFQPYRGPRRLCI